MLAPMVVAALATTVTVPTHHAVAISKRWRPQPVEIAGVVGFVSSGAVARYVDFALAAQEPDTHGVIHIDDVGRLSAFIVHRRSGLHIFKASLTACIEDDDWNDSRACALSWYSENISGAIRIDLTSHSF